MKRRLTVCSLVVLLLGLISWQPQSGLSFNGSGQVKLSVKSTDGIGNDSALWVKNLSTRHTRYAVGNDSGFAQELSSSSESIAGDKIVRLDESSLKAVRGSNDLLVRSDERVAAIVAPAELPIEQSEFYYYQQENINTPLAPKWVIELGAVGKSGENVLKANSSGYAPAITGQSESAKRYMFGVGVALRRENSSVEVKLINKAGHVIKSVEITGPTKLYWRTDLGEFISGTEDFPSRIQMTVLAGKAQGFLSITDLENDGTQFLPVAPMGKNGKGVHALASGPYGGGYAYFTNVYSCPYSPYSYVVYGAPPNTCGTLKLLRNGNLEVTPNWICTDANGGVTKGPWSVSKTETVQSVRIEWPDGSRTFGGDYHIDDNTAPNIWSNQTPGVGVPIPNTFGGGGSDTLWGTGFNFASGGWSYLYATFQDTTTGLYWNGSCYCSSTQKNFDATASPPAGGFSFTWSVASPPPSAHNNYDTYVWCIRSKDYCFPAFNCLYFYGPR